MTQFILKWIIPPLLLATLVTTVRGQSMPPVAQQTDTITFGLRAVEGRQQLALRSPLSTGNIVDITDVSLDDADLLLQAESKLLRPRKMRFSLVVQLVTSQEGHEIASEWVQGNKAATVFTVRFQDLTEKGLFLNKEYQLILTKSAYYDGLTSVEEAPRFQPKGKGVAYPALLLGVGALGMSETVFRQQAVAAYDRYEQHWAEGGLTAGNRYEEYQSALARQKTSRWVGYAALGIGVGILGSQWLFDHHPKRKVYELYRGTAGQTVRWEPSTVTSPLGVSAGVSLRVNF
ncbi:MAG: hypothetical protein AAGJ82_13230 [Bacteroidota bacterium]